MNDQPNLRQFLDEMGSFTDEAGAAGPAAGSDTALPPIGHAVRVATSPIINGPEAPKNAERNAPAVSGNGGSTRFLKT